MSVTIRIGTRGSQLALWQARTVAALLEGTSAGGPRTREAEAVTCEIVVIKTSGDKLQDAPLSEAGGKRLFVREIEDALLDGRVDVAVHSAKDMPVIAVDGLTIAAVLPREEPWDAIVLPASAAGAASATSGAADDAANEAPNETAGDAAGDAASRVTLDALIARLRSGASLTVGTSSVRRVTQLQRVLPGATFAPIRGNLDTRLRKLDEGQYDVLVLAAAGLKRLGAGDRISARVPLDACVPAPGQGTIAVQVRADDERTLPAGGGDWRSRQRAGAPRGAGGRQRARRRLSNAHRRLRADRRRSARAAGHRHRARRLARAAGVCLRSGPRCRRRLAGARRRTCWHRAQPSCWRWRRRLPRRRPEIPRPAENPARHAKPAP